MNAAMPASGLAVPELTGEFGLRRRWRALSVPHRNKFPRSGPMQVRQVRITLAKPFGDHTPPDGLF
jgi:hypothetical protein